MKAKKAKVYCLVMAVVLEPEKRPFERSDVSHAMGLPGSGGSACHGVWPSRSRIGPDGMIHPGCARRQYGQNRIHHIESRRDPAGKSVQDITMALNSQRGPVEGRGWITPQVVRMVQSAGEADDRRMVRGECGGLSCEVVQPATHERDFTPHSSFFTHACTMRSCP